MADRVYQWDRDNLSYARQRLEREKSNLEANRSAVENLKSDIMERWQSYSGEMYLENLEIDVENLRFLIEAVGELSELFDKVINDAYGECEKWTRTGANRLASSIRPL